VCLSLNHSHAPSCCCAWHHHHQSSDSSMASSKAKSPHSVTLCFLFKVSVPSVFLNVIKYLLTFASSSSRPFYLSLKCFRRHFLRKMWPIQLMFLIYIIDRTFHFSLSQGNTSSFLTRSVQLIFSILLQHHIRNVSVIPDLLCPSSSTIHSYAPNVAFQLFLHYILSPISWWQMSSCWMPQLPTQSWV
jgi:hypothetical protein